jgi:predicted phosphoribosyltransferase/dienelactone hydrolase
MDGYRDRREAGVLLAERLAELVDQDPVVLAVPRGGVPVGVEVARRLGLAFDIVVVRKLGLPGQPELAMGAVGEGGVTVMNEEIVGLSRIGSAEITAVEERERAEVASRAVRLRGGRPAVPLAGRVVLLVDDGIATGSTMVAACRVVRAAGASRVVVAVPVASTGAVSWLRREADEVVVLMVPDFFGSVGEWYADFQQVPDDEVVRQLRSVDEATVAEVRVPTPDGGMLPGTLAVPAGAKGLVVFAHGSGSSRHSPRNQYVAQRLVDAGLGTLLLDLLHPHEAEHRAAVFDVDLLAGRLEAVLRWLAEDPRTQRLPVGLFGASTGAAAALAAASLPGSRVAAVVSRGGRPDLAGDRLGRVTAPTLLVVGGWDEQVLELNEQAQRALHCPSRLAVVPGATHLFEEPGTLEQVADLARDWFLDILSGVRT